VGDRKA
jgi:hypothetical protein